MKNRNRFVLTSIALAVSALMNQASAQQNTAAPANSADDAKSLRVEVTGSSIRRVDAESALPITVIKSEDFTDRGFTTLADVLDGLTVAQSVVPGGNSSGAVVNMRGIGVNRTLTLMNGVRMAYEPTQASFVNMDLIPMSAIERVEVLRDGASSIYGSDAIGGVVNYITRKSYQGAALKAQMVMPQAKGGADEQMISGIGGMGDLQTDGWTFYSTFQIHKRSVLMAYDRPDLGTVDQLNNMGIGPKSSVGAYATPANIIKPITGNPYFATGCQPPYSTPALQGTCINNNNQLYQVLLPGNAQASLFTRGAMKLGNDNTLSLEIAYATEYINLSKGSAATSVGKSSGSGGTPVLTMNPSSPFYPGGSAGVPRIAGVTNQPIQLQWEVDVNGPATLRNTQSNGRILLTDEGSYAGWDYKVNLMAGNEYERTRYLTGYFDGPQLNLGVLNGILNPFGAQTQAGMDYLKKISVVGNESRYGTSQYDSFGFTINRDLMKLAGGALAIAFGGDYHYEAFRDSVPASNVNVPFDGRTPYDLGASRRVSALFTELDVPITKELDINLAVRADKYYDVGNTVNPKASFRYQPLKQLMFRGSYNTGFHAPSLIERYGSTKSGISSTKDAYDDPILCPGGTPGKPGTGNALPGYSPAVVCNAKQFHITGANPDLAPEKSKAFTLGVVVDPIKNLSIAVDYWRIHLKDTIGTLADSQIFASPERYASFFIRDANKNLVYVNAQSKNLGDTITSGEDITVNYVMPNTPYGKFTFGLDGTYTNMYDYQTEPGGDWIHNVGSFGGLANGAVSGDKIMTFRWKHQLRLGWARGDWRAQITEKYVSGYHDGTAVSPEFYRDISTYSVTNLTGAYTGFKNLTINAAINNVFDVMPPLTNTISAGYLRTYANPIGRVFNLTATYKF